MRNTPASATGTTRINLSLPRNLHSSIKATAAMHSITVPDLLSRQHALYLAATEAAQAGKSIGFTSDPSKLESRYVGGL